MVNTQPILWSDIDGTTVARVGPADPRNWLKYPLQVIEGYDDFLQGVKQSGVEFGGFVSRRPNIAVRRWATARSIARLGLTAGAGKTYTTMLAGSEMAKAQFIAAQSQMRTVGMLEDQPDRLVKVLLNLLTDPLAHTDAKQHTIVIGSVADDRTMKHFEIFIEGVTVAASDMTVKKIPIGYDISGRSFRILMMVLRPYCYAEGRRFAAQLKEGA